MPSPNDLAASGTVASFVPFQLFAGEKEVVTANDPVAPNTTLQKHQVVAKNSSGQLVAHNPAAGDSTNKAVGVTAQPIVTGGSPASVPYFISAYFNHEALVWHANTDTLVERKAAFVGTEIAIGTLHGAA